MKKIGLFSALCLVGLNLIGCDIDTPRPYTADVKIYVKDVPTDVKAMSIWCTANNWDENKVNGSEEYIVEVKEGVAEFTLKSYPLSKPLQFQFTPMLTKDTTLGSDWWNYAISGSSKYANDKNNMTCNFSGGTTITLSKDTYGADSWKTQYPIYGVVANRWNNEDWKECFSNTP